MREKYDLAAKQAKEWEAEEKKPGRVRQQPDGRWHAQFQSIPFGQTKPKRYIAKNLASEGAAQDALTGLRARALEGKFEPEDIEPVVDSRPYCETFGERLEAYLKFKSKGGNAKSRGIGASTVQLYRFRIDRWKRATVPGDESRTLGDVRLDELNLPLLTAVCDAWMDGKDGGREGAANSTHISFKLAQAALFQCPEKDRARQFKAWDWDEGPAKPSSEPRHDPFHREEVGAILEAIDRPIGDDNAVDQHFAALVDLLFHTGLRIGEALALHWEDIDLRRGTINVAHTVWDKQGGPARGPVKTKASKAVIDISSDEELVDRFRKLRALGGAIPLPNSIVFPTESGGYQRSGTLRRQRWTPLLKSLGLRDRGFHQSRHSFAQVLVDQGYTIAEVSGSMRHADSSITAKQYVESKGVTGAAGQIRKAIRGSTGCVLGADSHPAERKGNS